MPNELVEYNYPFLLLEKWISLAKTSYKKSNLINYNAATLSTISNSGMSSRIILVKQFTPEGLYFYTNLNSRKAKSIKENNSVTLLFYWETINKQIRIEGKAYQITEKEADDYFASRPYMSKIGAWASKQSEEMNNRLEFEKRIMKFCMKFKHKVPRPDFWSGFKVIPDYFEFWENANFRLHTRTSYTKTNEGFKKTILYP